MDNSIFPLPFSAHMIFVAIAFIFFLVQFIRLRYKYQLILAVASSCSALIYFQDTKTWFYGVGLVEFGLLLLALVMAIVEKRKRKALEKQAETENQGNGEEASLDEIGEDDEADAVDESDPEE